MEEFNQRCSRSVLLASNSDLDELSSLAPEELISNPVSFTLRNGESSTNENIAMFERLGYSLVSSFIDEGSSEWVDNVKDNFESISDGWSYESYESCRARKLEMNESLHDDVVSAEDLFGEQLNFDITLEVLKHVLDFSRAIITSSKQVEEVDLLELKEELKDSEPEIRSGLLLNLQPYLLASLVISDQSGEKKFIEETENYLNILEEELAT